MKNAVVHIAETKDFSSEALVQLRSFTTVREEPISSQLLKKSLQNCDIFWFRLGFKVTADVFSEDTRCKIIVCPVTGLDHIDLEACAKAGIEVLSLKGEVTFLQSVRATAELTLGLTLSLMRNIPQAVLSTAKGEWERDQFKGTEILNKKVGIVGVGRLGSIVAGYFKALGAEVFGFDKREFDHAICTPARTIKELVSIADILSIHLSYQSDTHYFIDKTLLALMKPTAILINTARGSIVHSQDLLDALNNKRLAGAALDVIENEYSVKNNPLLTYASTHQNLLITPHLGGNTVESFEKTELFMVEKLKAKLNGSI